MRKLFVVITAILIFFVGYSFADSFAQKYISALDRVTSSLSVEAKQSYYNKALSLLTSYAYTFAEDVAFSDDISLLKNYVDTKIKELNTEQEPSIEYIASSMNLPHVDIQKVRNVRLDLHNTERNNQGLPYLKYSSDLEGTATTWATYLAGMGRTTHRRKNTDSYYSYFSIKNRFLDQGIQFVGKEVGGVTLFTENIGRGYYNCTSSDCTDVFIKAITTSRNFFMREKYRSYKPHYNAIIGKQFTTLGLGVALVGKKYYLVSHYTQDLE